MWLHVPGCGDHSHSAPGTEVSISEPGWFCPVFSVWVLLNDKPTRRASSSLEWRKVPWIRLLYGTISRPSTAGSIAAAWISSLPVSPAKGQASPASGAESMTIDGSGLTSSASSARAAPSPSSSRTCPDSSPLIVAERSRKSSGTWARAGSLRNGIVSRREPSAPRTSEIVSSCSLPTPTASQYGSSQNGINGVGGEFERPSAGTLSLQAMAARGMLPTPLASDARRSLGQSERPRSQGPTLHEAIVRSRNATPSTSSDVSTGNGPALLNPRFVEWMMGLPKGWISTVGPSDMPTSCTPSAMESCPTPPPTPSPCSSDASGSDDFG